MATTKTRHREEEEGQEDSPRSGRNRLSSKRTTKKQGFDGERRLYRLNIGLHYGEDLDTEPEISVNNVTGIETAKRPTRKWDANEDNLVESEIDLVKRCGADKFSYVSDRSYQRWLKRKEKEEEVKMQQERDQVDEKEVGQRGKRKLRNTDANTGAGTEEWARAKGRRVGGEEGEDGEDGENGSEVGATGEEGKGRKGLGDSSPSKEGGRVAGRAAPNASRKDVGSGSSIGDKKDK